MASSSGEESRLGAAGGFDDATGFDKNSEFAGGGGCNASGGCGGGGGWDDASGYNGGEIGRACDGTDWRDGKSGDVIDKESGVGEEGGGDDGSEVNEYTCA